MMRALFILSLLMIGNAAYGMLVSAEPMLYSSSNGAYTLCIVPAKYDFRPTTDPRLVRAFAESPHCVASLFVEYPSQKAKVSKWIIVLPNRNAPDSAIIANSGKFFATSGEQGNNDNDSLAICLFDGDGKLIKSYRIQDLLDLVEEGRFFLFPDVCGHISWGRIVGFDEAEEHLLVDVLEEYEDLKPDAFKYRRILISLKTGELVKTANKPLRPVLPKNHRD